MKSAKKILPLILCVFVLLAGCSDADIKNKNDNRIKIVATIFPLCDFAKNIAGDKAEVKMLLPAGAEVHSYEATPRDIIEIKESDLFVNIGGSADPWTDAVINDADGTLVNTVSASEFIDLEKEEAVEGMEEEKDASGEEELDEHVWTTPVNAVKICGAIYDRLCEISPENTETFTKNFESYKEKLNELDKEIRKVTEKAKRKTIVFADRFPFRYFADEYKLNYFAAFPGCSSESEPSAATVKFLIDKIRNEKIPVVYYTETSNMHMADTVCEATGAEKILMHSCHTVNKKQLKNGASYIGIMKDNIKALEKGLF